MKYKIGYAHIIPYNISPVLISQSDIIQRYPFERLIFVWSLDVRNTRPGSLYNNTFGAGLSGHAWASLKTLSIVSY